MDALESKIDALDGRLQSSSSAIFQKLDAINGTLTSLQVAVAGKRDKDDCPGQHDRIEAFIKQTIHPAEKNGKTTKILLKIVEILGIVILSMAGIKLSKV